MKFSFGHICLFVSDLERSLDFYCNQLGFTKMFEEDYPQFHLHNVYLRIGPSQFIELFGNLPEIDSSKASIKHFCLHVDDARKAHAELSARGLPVSDVRVGGAKCVMFNLTDPDGNVIEIMELTPESLHAIHDHD